MQPVEEKTMSKIIAIILLWGIYVSVAQAADEVHNPLYDCPVGTDVYPSIKDLNYYDGSSRRVITEMKKIYFFELPSDADQVDASETARATRIAGDLKVLRDIAGNLGGYALYDGSGDNKKHCYKFDPQYLRSTLTITPKIANKADAKLGKAIIITGPIEHFWLSADMGVSNVKQLALDANGKPAPKDKPASFYVGFNWKIGDVYETRPHNWYESFSAKLLLHAAGSPSDSIGMGVSYDLPEVLSIPGATIFFARVKTKNDLGATWSNFGGLSFDLTRGLEWLKSSKP
jgi:hypothetical protein